MGRGDREPAPTYEGSVCKHCGGTIRYVSNYTCVACAATHSGRTASRARARAVREALRHKAAAEAAKSIERYAEAERMRVRWIFDWRG